MDEWGGEAGSGEKTRRRRPQLETAARLDLRGEEMREWVGVGGMVRTTWSGAYRGEARTALGQQRCQNQGNLMWNTFYYCNFFQFSMDFELFKRFWVKAELTELNSDRLIAILIANPPELQFGQEVLHGDL
jgi:hypothetical protein